MKKLSKGDRNYIIKITAGLVLAISFFVGLVALVAFIISNVMS